MSKVRAKGRNIGSTALSLVISLFSLVLMPMNALPDEVTYFYDDAGQLNRAANSTQGVSYQYDANGNLISIDSGTVSTSPPTIQSVTPNVVFAGTTTKVVITGQSLFTTKNITADNFSLSISVVSVADRQITAAITVPSGASPGTGNFTLTTAYGSISNSLTVSSSQLKFAPDDLILPVGGTGSIAVSITPSIGQSLTLWLSVSNQLTASCPASVTVSAGGTGSFQVNGIAEGNAIITSSGADASIFVAPNFSPLPGETISRTTNPISVSIDSAPSAQQSGAAAKPVSVYVDSAPSAQQSGAAAKPVSVYVDSAPSIGQSGAAASPVSVGISP
jgi:YD repeat-containing protein